MVSLRLCHAAPDTDPLPRAAAVGQGSAYRAMADAVDVVPVGISISVLASSSGPVPALVPLPEWDFETADGRRLGSVTVPHGWSRRHEALRDYRGPAIYTSAIRSDARRARVLFGSIDYLAKVFLDGKQAIAHEGGFTPVAVEVPTGTSTTISVWVNDPVEAELQQPDPLLKPKVKIKGVHEWHDSRPGGMAIGAGYDPAWVSRWGSGGIVRPVWLHETGSVRIEGAFCTAIGSELRLSWILSSDRETDIALRAVVDDQGLGISAHVGRGHSRMSVRVTCHDAAWWTPDTPHLYHLVTSVLLGDEVSDTQVTAFGFRSVRLDASSPGGMQLILNDQATYVRAANYIPGPWTDEISDSLIDEDVRLAKAAGLNSLGAHAGVWPDLLDAADRRGVLVYQDFPMQWSYDPARPAVLAGGSDLATASLELAAELVYDLYNHPSLVYWCAHNEPAYQLLEAFDRHDVPELAPMRAQLLAVPDEEELDARRAELIRHVDPHRPAVPAAGLGASRPIGDVHDYTGSLSGGPVTDARTGSVAFVGEYGAWSADFCAGSDDHDWHQQTHLVSVQESYAGRRDRYEDFQTWCFAGQLWAGWHAKVATENARLSRFRPSAGARYHLLVDHYGVGGAGVIDRHRTTGPAYRGLAAANRATLALAPMPPGGVIRPGEQVRLPMAIVNDTATKAVRRLSWRLVQLGPDDAFVIGRDEPADPGPLQTNGAPIDQVAVLPRRPGSTLRYGDDEVSVLPWHLHQLAEVVWTPDRVGYFALIMDLDGVLGWTSFAVQADGSMPAPGLQGQTRFTVTSERPGRLVRRWTGDEVDPGNAPPDQYLFDGRPVDVYDDVHIDADGHVHTAALPWPDPLSSAGGGVPAAAPET